MRRRRVLLGVSALAAAGVLAAAFLVVRYVVPRGRAEAARELRDRIGALSTERDVLRARRAELFGLDERVRTMPDTAIRIGVPTTLADTLIRKVFAGFADHAVLELGNIRVRKAGEIHKVVTLGEYDLRVAISRARGRLKAGTPTVTFGSDAVGIDLPVALASGTGEATVDFSWRGRNIGGVVCGDMSVSKTLTAAVLPARHQVRASLGFGATSTHVVITPKIAPLSVVLKVEPSVQAWADVQAVIDEKRGVCGFVLDRVDIIGAVRRLVDRGFKVRIPVEKVRAATLPVGVDPQITVAGRSVALAVKVGVLSVTPHTVWLGVDVQLGAS